MKKKTMKAIFWTLFILGIVIGYLLPGNLQSISERMQNPLKPGVYDISKRMGQLNEQTDSYKFLTLAKAEDTQVQLLRIDSQVPLGTSEEDYFFQIFKGNAKFVISGQTLDAYPNQIVVIPEGTSYSIERVGDTPLEVIRFSSLEED